jgi:hypothetical protein
MRLENSPQLPGAGRHHHGNDTPTSTRAIYVLKSANSKLFYTPLYFLIHVALENIKKSPQKAAYFTHSQMGHYFFSYLLTLVVDLIEILEILA